MKIIPLASCGAEIKEFSPRNAGEEELRQFDEAFRQYSLLVIRGLTDFSPEEHAQLMQRLGPLAVEFVGAGPASYVAHDPATPKALSFALGELNFHSDLAFTEKWLSWIVSLYGEEVTKTGGETLFVHTGKAFDRLDPETKAAIENRRGLYLFNPYGPSDIRPTEESIGTFGDRGIHEVIGRHPYDGSAVLTVNIAMTDRIIGLPRAQSDALLQRIFDVMYAPDAIYTHKWQVGDLIVWDNRVMQHARNTYDPSERRKLRRIAIGDEPSIQYLFRRWVEQVPAE